MSNKIFACWYHDEEQLQVTEIGTTKMPTLSDMVITIDHRMPVRAALLSEVVNSCYIQVLEVLVFLVTDTEEFYNGLDGYISSELRANRYLV